MADLDVVCRCRVAEVDHTLLEICGDPLSLDVPVDPSAEVRDRFEDIENVAPVGGQRRIGVCRNGDEQRRVGHPGSVLEQCVEGLLPLTAEMDVVMFRARRQVTLHPGQPEQARRGVVPFAQNPGHLELGQHRRIRNRGIGVDDDDIGRDHRPVGETHAAYRPVASGGAQYPFDLGAVAEQHAALLRRLRQPAGNRMHAALREVHTGDRVHVRDHGIRAEGLVRR